MSMTTTDINVAVDSYIAAWNEADPDARRRLIAVAVSDDAAYVDPMLAGERIDGIDAMVAAAQQQMAGVVLRRTGEIDCHHDRVRFAWEGVGPDGEPVIAGVDFGIVAPDGRLQSITGFFDLVPEL
jgi:hypothetical protein